MALAVTLALFKGRRQVPGILYAFNLKERASVVLNYVILVAKWHINIAKIYNILPNPGADYMSRAGLICRDLRTFIKRNKNQLCDYMTGRLARIAS